MADELNGEVFEKNLGYDVTKLGMQANREINQTVEEKTDREVYDRDATSISIGENFSLAAGDERKLEIVATPAISNVPAVAWETSNPEVAVVESTGIVRGVGRGSATITATDVENNTVTASVTVTVSDVNDPVLTLAVEAGEGTVSGAGTYPAGTEVEISATPAEHWEFQTWDDDSTDAGNATRTVEVPASGATFKATFVKTKVTITVVAGENGTVSGGGEVDYGTEVTIVATPNDGFVFDKWNDDDTNATRTIEATANATYTASFKSAE